MVPEVERPAALEYLINLGEVTPPAERGMPDLEPELADEVDSLTEIIIADRDRSRRR